MYLKSIEISGFKSFAKKSELVFNTPISAIVGPNGSGKSNVAEAFRFVLGEQSMKSLRGKKGEDLIFNGASEGARANRASVKVVFDNSRRFFAGIDFNEVILERSVHRDGVNEYFINGTLVRLKDIIELLASAHIGSSGHHIISQGEADRILNSSPKDRRAMIEDALGLKIYQYKREESDRKLIKTEENIQSVELLRKEIAPHLKFLKRQVEKIEKAAEQKNELTVLALEYLKREKVFIDKTLNDIEEKTAPLHQKKIELAEELRIAKSVLENSQKDAKREEVIAIETALHSARMEKDRVLESLGGIRGEIAAEERIVKKQKELVLSETGKTILLSDVESFSEGIKQKMSTIETSEDLSYIRSLISEIKDSFNSFLSERRAKSDDTVVREAEVHIAQLHDEKLVLEEQLVHASENEKKLDEEYRELKISIEKEKDSNRDAEKSLFRIMADEQAVHSELSILRSKKDQIIHIEEEFKREREECAMLVGRAVLDYDAFQFDDALFEERSVQEERRRTIEKIKIRLEEAGLSGSSETLKEYTETLERDTFLARELEDLYASAGSLRTLIADLGETIDTEFHEGVRKINTEFGTFFETMFGGGTARLTIVKEKKKVKKEYELEGILSSDDFISEEEKSEEGIDIDVALPRKKIKGLMMLSGGERALTSIALLFAMSQVKPPPFIILDETDAALDEANSKKYGDMVEGLAKYSQLILITHNRETMSRAGVIYGVTMGSGGISKILSIQFDEAVVVAK